MGTGEGAGAGGSREENRDLVWEGDRGGSGGLMLMRRRSHDESVDDDDLGPVTCLLVPSLYWLDIGVLWAGLGLLDQAICVVL